MSSVTLIILVVLILGIAYVFYGRKIEKLWQIDPKRPTPATVSYDGVDYVPAKNWLVLFGHHFSSIAGAGPIIGPVIAVCFWGWAPALLWVVFGSILIGGIHDFGSLMISVRENGVSIADIAAKTISHKAKIILSIFMWLALLLVIAVFAYLAAKTFVAQPEIILPSLGLIPVAMLVGFALYHLKWNPTLVTIAGLMALAGLMIAGEFFPIKLGGTNALSLWIIVLLIYCFFASTLPVNLLLQPRDYLSSFLLMGGMGLGILGIFVSHPTVNTPAFMGNKTDLGYLWPAMFITVACGATSGFHSLIASGTTSKQLATERHARRIAYGGMLVEGLLAALVIILIIGGFTLEEFHQHIAAKTDPVNMFGLAFGKVTAPIAGKWGTYFALAVLNAFILTTLDTATRITRYISQELFHIKNRYVSTSLVVGLGGWLALGKDSTQNPLWQRIWPAFGASNQLVAALALLVVSTWLLSRRRPTKLALIPAIFMLATSVTALGFQMQHYIISKDFLLIAVTGTLMILALYLTKEVIITFQKVTKSA